jgi:hypothetical protein
METAVGTLLVVFDTAGAGWGASVKGLCWHYVGVKNSLRKVEDFTDAWGITAVP